MAQQGDDVDHPRGPHPLAGIRAESAEDVATRIRRLLAYVAPDKLWLNPDCGFWETPRWVTRRKLQALAAGARIVRRELGH